MFMKRLMLVRRRAFFLVLLVFTLFIFIFYKDLLGTKNLYDEMRQRGFDVKRGYIINTPACKIPNFEPSPHSMAYYFKSTRSLSCFKGSGKNITSSRRNMLYFYPENIQFKQLKGISKSDFDKLRKDLLLKSKSASSIEVFLSKISMNCCYKSIERVNQTRENYNRKADLKYRLSDECFAIKNTETEILNFDAVVVNCFFSKVIFYTNVHHLVQKKIDAAKTEVKPKEEDSQPLSVIIFGTDSVSRLNFMRINPLSYKYLMKEMHAFEFKGYNKVADNTLPNLIPIFTGMSVEEMLEEHCFSKVDMEKEPHDRKFDDCPFIWKNFKKRGYVTTLMEDSCKMATFNYGRTGFVDQPTDHYTRPSFLVSEDLIGWNTQMCQGLKLSCEVIHDYSLDIEETYRNIPTFSFYWTASVTHDYLNLGAVMDKPQLRYLKTLKESGVLNHTVLFFISDHGMRFGRFRRTYMGKFEESLPYLFVVVPDWFRKRYPIASKNLEKNTVTLSTHFDVHETLRDILEENYKNETYLREFPSKIARKISLFQELPDTRTCKNIGIPIKYCTCLAFVPLENVDQLYSNLGNYIKRYLNNIFTDFPSCAKIKNVLVLNALKGHGEKNVFGTVIGEIISVEAEYDPGHASIEATIVWNKYEEYPFQIVGDISRTNKYGNQSHCITDTEIKKFCICKDMV